MKKLMFFLMLHSFVTFGQKETVNTNDSLAFHIYLGEGFHDDHISLKINSVLVLDSVSLSSHKILGVTKEFARGYESIQHRKSFSIETRELLSENQRLVIKKKKIQRIEFIFSGKSYLFNFDLSKGKYLIIDNSAYHQTVTFQQFVDEPGFE